MCPDSEKCVRSKQRFLRAINSLSFYFESSRGDDFLNRFSYHVVNVPVELHGTLEGKMLFHVLLLLFAVDPGSVFLRQMSLLRRSVRSDEFRRAQVALVTDQYKHRLTLLASSSSRSRSRSRSRSLISRNAWRGGCWGDRGFYEKPFAFPPCPWAENALSDDCRDLEASCDLTLVWEVPTRWFELFLRWSPWDWLIMLSRDNDFVLRREDRNLGFRGDCWDFAGTKDCNRFREKF